MNCKELSEKYNIPWNCCGGCHDDADMGFAEMPEREIDGQTVRICCKMLMAYDKIGEKCNDPA